MNASAVIGNIWAKSRLKSVTALGAACFRNARFFSLFTAPYNRLLPGSENIRTTGRCLKTSITIAPLDFHPLVSSPLVDQTSGAPWSRLCGRAELLWAACALLCRRTAAYCGTTYHSRQLCDAVQHTTPGYCGRRSPGFASSSRALRQRPTLREVRARCDISYE